MNEQDVKEHIEFAKKIVSDQPEPFKTESFKIILNALLNSNATTKKSPSSKQKNSTKTQVVDNSDKLTIVENSDEVMLELSTELGIELDQLQDTISVHDNKIEIISSINDSSSKQKMIKASLCILILFEKFYNSQWVKSTIIAEQLREMGIQDMGSNLSTYLKNESTLFRFRGAGTNREYKLTTTEGRKKALEILKELSVGEQSD